VDDVFRRLVAQSNTSRTTPAKAERHFQNLETTMRRRSISLAVGLLFSVAVCGGSSDSGTTGPNNNNQTPTATNGTFTATINGVAWGAAGTVSVNHSSGLISIAGFGQIGTSTGYSVALAIGATTGPGTVSLNYLNPTTSLLIVGSSTGAGWTTFSNGGTGTMTITTLTSNHIVATFTADAVATSGGATGTIPIRNGKLDVTF